MAMNKALKNAHQELLEVVREHQGLIFKFVKKGGKFFYTICGGQLMLSMGLAPGKIIGKELSEFWPSETVEMITKFYNLAWEGKENVTYEGEINGISYIAYLRPVKRNGKVIEVIGSCVDITERKILEERLRANEYKYRLIAENSQDLIGLLDANGIIRYASPSHEKVLGIPPESYEGNSAFDRVHPDDVANIKKQCATMVGSVKSSPVEFRYKHASGDWVYLEAIRVPIFNEKKEIQNFVVVARDISERKRAEALLQKKDRLSIVGQLAAGVAHEIRNPLTSIKGFVQLLQNEVDQPFYTNIIMSEIDKLEEIVKRFLFLSEPISPHKEIVDVKELLEQVVRLFHSQAILYNVDVVQEPFSGFPSIYCDGHQIRQVFLNILQNAVEAMPNGGMINIQTICEHSDFITFRFIDQGIGISEERIKKIGEPFFSNKEKGIGLGLMMSNKIIQEHGGTINIRSQVNKGTAVEVMLPIDIPLCNN